MWGCVFVAGIVFDFRVATPVMEEQVGRFGVGDLGKTNLYSDKKNLAHCFHPTKGRRRTSRSDTLLEFDVSGGMPL